MSNDFEPENLDKNFINEIYEEALTDDKHPNLPVEVLKPDIVKNRSGLVLLSPKTIIEYSEYIDYMFGQIKAFHDSTNPFMPFNNGFISYLNTYWTRDVDTILKLYALGIANNSILPFGVAKNGVVITRKDPSVIPTLNTEDPKFDEWFEKVYKKEYKPKFTNDREPHDD